MRYGEITTRKATMGSRARPHRFTVLRGSFESSTDAALVEAALGGQTAAFDELARRCTPRILATAQALIRDQSEVADVCQEALLRAHRDLVTLIDPRRFESWVTGIARHVALDVVRRKQRRPVAAFDETRMEQIVDLNASAYDHCVAIELAARLRAGAARLSPRDAALIVMVAELGFSVKEVAEALHVSSNAAKVAIHRARRRLGEQLSA